MKAARRTDFLVKTFVEDDGLATPFRWHSYRTLQPILLALFLIYPEVAGVISTGDPCNIWNHQSAVKAGKLWIDGGVVTTWAQAVEDRDIGYNPQLLSLDLAVDWEATDSSFMQANVVAYNKLDRTPAVPPRQNGGLFPGGSDDVNIYLLGGIVSPLYNSELNWTEFNSADPTLWTFNTLSLQWTNYSGPRVLEAILKLPSTGAVVAAPEAEIGLFINGQLDSPPPAGPEIVVNPEADGTSLVPGMLILDTNDRSARNVSTPNLTGGNTTTRGAAGWFPNIGSHGMVVRMGGIRAALSSDDDDIAEEEFIGFDMIDVLDLGTIVSDRISTEASWYQQNATGEIPSVRSSFCAVTVSAQDNSSHHVYIYGGRNGQQRFDEIYALSIPAFRWTRLYSGEGPRFYHTCHLVAGSKLMSIGGLSSDIFVNDCDVNNNIAISIFDMNVGQFTYNFASKEEPFEVPAAIYNYIGGDGKGGATAMKPDGGFSDPAIEALFAPPNSTDGTNVTSTDGNNATSNTSPSASNDGNGSKNHAGAIAGGVVGGVVAIVLIAGLVWWYFRKRRSNTEPDEAKNDKGSDDSTGFDNMQSGAAEQQNNTISEYVQDDRNNQRYATPLLMGHQENLGGHDDDSPGFAIIH